MKLNKKYWFLIVIAIIFILLNPSNRDFRNFVASNKYPYHGKRSKNYSGRVLYLGVFSIYKYEYVNRSYQPGLKEVIYTNEYFGILKNFISVKNTRQEVLQ